MRYWDHGMGQNKIKLVEFTAEEGAKRGNECYICLIV